MRINGNRAFLLFIRHIEMIDGQAFLTTKYLGAQGLFVAVIVALITSGNILSLSSKPKNHHNDAGSCTACGSAFI